MQQKTSGGFGETVRTVLIAVVIAFVVRTFAYEPFNIPSGSMVPTLLVGDYLFVSKFSYGYSRYSVAFGLPIFDGRIFGNEPERGDVIVFKLPSDPSTDYIKRLIGLPGDRVQMIEGVLHLNGEPVPRQLVGDYVQPGRLSAPARRYEMVLPGGRTHSVVERGDDLALDNTAGIHRP